MKRIKGLVTDVNEDLLCFQVDKTTTVHMVLLFLENPKQQLPLDGSEIIAESEVFRANRFEVKTLILYPGTKFEGLFMVTPQTDKFVQLVRNTNVGALDLLEIDANYRKLHVHLSSPYLVTIEDLIMSIIENIPKNWVAVTHSINTRQVFPKFRLRLITQIGFVDPAPDNYRNLSYWTFGNHWSVSKTGKDYYLIGYLFVHQKYGTVCFTDFTRIISCTITNLSKDSILKLICRYIVIKKYTIITEIYNSEKFASLEYLLADSKDITILPFTCNFNRKFMHSALPENFYHDTCLEFKIMSKSMPLLNSKGRLECWLCIKIEDLSQVFMCLNASYTEAFPLLKEDCMYKLYFRGSLRNIVNKETKFANSTLPQYELPENALFVLTATESDSRLNSIKDAAQANQLLGSSCTDLVTFHAKLITKKFVDPLSSRTEKLTRDLNFGTPGTKTHLLEFDANGTILTVYLNNWDNMSIPYCLIPNMRVIVHNVLPQKGRYYKSTAMTSFEVVSYEPGQPFETANLRSNTDWGIPYFFGAASIPLEVIMWTRTAAFFILGLKVFRKCVQCGGKVQLKQGCQSCQESSHKLTATITLIVKDLMHESKVIAKDNVGMLLLQLLVRAQLRVFEIVSKGFEFMDSYEFYKGKTAELDEMVQDGTGYARSILTSHFININECGMSLELKARKIGNEANGNSLFYLLDARGTLTK